MKAAQGPTAQWLLEDSERSCSNRLTPTHRKHSRPGSGPPWTLIQG